MKIEEYFKALEKFGITTYDFSRIRPISHNTLKRCLEKGTMTRETAEKLAKATRYQVTLKDLGFQD